MLSGGEEGELAVGGAGEVDDCLEVDEGGLAKSPIVAKLTPRPRLT